MIKAVIFPLVVVAATLAVPLDPIREANGDEQTGPPKRDAYLEQMEEIEKCFNAIKSRRIETEKYEDLAKTARLMQSLLEKTIPLTRKKLETLGKVSTEAGFLEAFGDDRHSSLAKLRWGQGRLLAQMGRSDQAFAVYTKALGRLDPSFERHPLRAQLLEGLGDLLEERNDQQQARQYYQQAYRILTATYGTQHPAVKNFEARHGG